MAILARPTKPILPKRIAIIPGVGLSGYIRAANRGMGRFRGLGQDTGEFAPTTNPPGQGYTPTDVTLAPPSVPSPFAQALAQSLPGLLAAWTNIGGRVIAPSVQYTGPGGVSYSAPASSTSGAIPFLPGASSSYFPLLLIGGGLIVVLLLVGEK